MCRIRLFSVTLFTLSDLLLINRLKSCLSVNRCFWTLDQRSTDEDDSCVNNASGSAWRRVYPFSCYRIHMCERPFSHKIGLSACPGAEPVLPFLLFPFHFVVVEEL